MGLEDWLRTGSLRPVQSPAVESDPISPQAVVQQLRERFPPVQLLDAFGIVQPEFWLQPDALNRFKVALEVLIEQYCVERTMQPAAAARPAPTARAAAAAAARQAAAEEEAAAEDAAAAAQRRQQELAELMRRIQAVNAELTQLLPAALQPEPDVAAKARLLELQAQLQQLDMQLGPAQAALPAMQLAPQAPTAAPVPQPPPPAPAAVINVAPLLNKQLLLLQADAFAAEMAARALRYADWHTEQQAAIAAKRPPLPCATEHLWRLLVAQRAVLDRISEFYRLAELVGCQPTGSVSNEQRFSDVNNIKTKLRSSLGVNHLNACVRIGTTSHTLDTFPFAAAYDIWKPPGSNSRYGG